MMKVMEIQITNPYARDNGVLDGPALVFTNGNAVAPTKHDSHWSLMSGDFVVIDEYQREKKVDMVASLAQIVGQDLSKVTLEFK